MKKLLALAFALMLIFSVALADEPLTIAVSMRSTASEYHMQYVAGAELFAASLPEGTAVVQALPCEGNDDKQINDINALIAAKGDNMILFVDANNAPNIVPIAEACEEAGVYWSAAWNAPEGVLPTDYDHWVTFQSCDAVEQGYVIAKTLFESFPTPGQGKICVLEGMLANNSNTDRMKGLKKALDEYPGIEVLDDQAGDWETGKALTITENWIAKYGEEMTGIWCASDDMAIGVVIATAFGKISASLVADIIMPLIGCLIGGVDLATLNITLKPAVMDGETVVSEAVVLGLGTFLTTIIDFLLIAFVVFLVVKAMNMAKAKLEKPAEPEPEKEPEPTKEEQLLTQIRDLLKNKKYAKRTR